MVKEDSNINFKQSVTVNVVAYNEKCEILLGKKPNESLYYLIGGFVDRTDIDLEHSARREFFEKTSGCEIDDLRYVASAQINDLSCDKSGIVRILFLGKFIFGITKTTNDNAELKWVNPFEVDVETEVIEEYQELYKKLLVKLNKLIY
jgi:bifunctional NMN adenylyltransferase/nudix hydrolase